jgi:predicted nucleic acid-binding protein
MSYRLVIDTNLFISAFPWEDVPLKLLHEATARRIPVLMKGKLPLAPAARFFDK